MKRESLAFVLIALATAACGGGDDSKSDTTGGGDTGTDGTVNPEVAKATVVSTISAVNQAMKSKEGQGLAFAMAALGASAFSIVTPASGAAAQSYDGDGLGQARQADGGGTCDCPAEGTKCTFKSCGDPAGTWTVSGSLSWGSGHMVGDLDFDGSYTGNEWKFHEGFDLEVTATSIDGTFESKGSYTVGNAAGSASGEWTTSLEYKEITFDAASCPTKGSLHVEAEITSNGFSYSGEGDVTIDGATCGG